MKKETIAQVLQFTEDRNWKQFHNPKDLAISICLEAAELLEVFQWSADDTECSDKIDRIREELADVLNYCILMADAYGLDSDEIILEKLKKNEQKYPVNKAYGKKEKYTQLKNQTDNM
ncbi:MAG: nucleotide pyrophosphohydrolase [Lachnospiraceae bacterium]